MNTRLVCHADSQGECSRVAVASLATSYETDLVANLADVHITHSATGVELQAITLLCKVIRLNSQFVRF